MKISIVVSDFSRNCMGRAYILAKMLECRFEIEVVGPLFEENIWFPCDTSEFIYKPIRCTPFLASFLNKIRKIESLIEGDIIYASKALFTSFGLGILSKLKRKRPLLLDIDDWELGWYLPYRVRKMASLSVRTFFLANGFLNTWFLEKVICLADGVTTASRFLQNRFGGEYIPHGRDTEFLDPSKFDGGKVKTELGLNEEKAIVFLGSPKPHKGIGDIFEALQLLNRSDVKLIIIGATNGNYLEEEPPSEIAPSVVIKGMIPFFEIPKYLATADLIVLPQNNAPSNYAQVPAKLFDAMAMGKPIVSTRMSDVPEILSDCGFIAEPGSPKDLAEKIDYILANPEEASEVGQRAREKCIREYSFTVVGRRLAEYIEQIVQ